MKQILANNSIRAREVRLVGANGDSTVIPLKDALYKANNAGLDLIQVTENTNPPVVKIADLNKFKYELQQNEKKAKKAQRAAAIQQKEIQFKTGIQQHDLNVKMNNAKTFLGEGKHVRFVLRIQGRRGKTDQQVLQQNLPFMETVLNGLGEIEILQKVQLSGNNMHCVVKQKSR